MYISIYLRKIISCYNAAMWELKPFTKGLLAHISPHSIAQ